MNLQRMANGWTKLHNAFRNLHAYYVFRSVRNTTLRHRVIDFRLFEGKACLYLRLRGPVPILHELLLGRLKRVMYMIQYSTMAAKRLAEEAGR